MIKRLIALVISIGMVSANLLLAQVVISESIIVEPAGGAVSAGAPGVPVMYKWYTNVYIVRPDGTKDLWYTKVDWIMLPPGTDIAGMGLLLQDTAS
jgi:hypothetical protein